MDNFNLEIKKDFEEIFANSNEITEILVEENKLCLICKNIQCSCSTFGDFNEIPVEKNDGFEADFNDADSVDRTKKPIGCRICDKKIYRPLSYDRHWQLSHRNVHHSKMYDTPEQCEICQRYLQNKQSLQCHVSAAHLKRKRPAAGPNHKLNATVTVNQQFCHLCGLVVSGPTDLKRHLKYIHHRDLRNTSDDIQSNVTSPQNSLSPFTMMTAPVCRKSLKCSTCGVNFNDEKSLIFHVLSLVCTLKQGVPEIHAENETSPLRKILEPFQMCNPNYSPDVVMVLQPFVMYPLERCDIKKGDELSPVPGDEKISSPLLNGEGDSSQNSQVEQNPYFFTDNIVSHPGKQLPISIDSQPFSHSAVPDCDFASSSTKPLTCLKTAHSFKSSVNTNIAEEAHQQLAVSQQEIEMMNGIKEPKRKGTIIIYCRVCKVKFCSCRDYRAHFLNRHPEYSPDEMFEDGWKCSQCHIVFQNLVGLRNHWVKQHKESYSKEMFINFAKQTITETKSSLPSCKSAKTVPKESSCVTESDVFKSVCKICEVLCVDKEQLLLHMSLVHRNMSYV